MLNLKDMWFIDRREKLVALAARVHLRFRWQFNRQARVLRRDLPRRLRAFTENFVDHYDRTDREFGTLARCLRGLFEVAQALGTLVNGRLLSVKQALSESRIAGPDGVAAGSLQDLRDGLAEAATELAVLQSVGHQLQKLRSHIGSVERVGLSIRAATFGFSVESARTEKCQQAFGSFWAEFRTLGDRITSVAEAIESHVAATRAAQRKEWMALGGRIRSTRNSSHNWKTPPVPQPTKRKRCSTLCSKDWRRQGNACAGLPVTQARRCFICSSGTLSGKRRSILRRRWARSRSRSIQPFHRVAFRPAQPRRIGSSPSKSGNLT